MHTHSALQRNAQHEHRHETGDLRFRLLVFQIKIYPLSLAHFKLNNLALNNHSLVSNSAKGVVDESEISGDRDDGRRHILFLLKNQNPLCTVCWVAVVPVTHSTHNNRLCERVIFATTSSRIIRDEILTVVSAKHNEVIERAYASVERIPQLLPGRRNNNRNTGIDVHLNLIDGWIFNHAC